MIRKIFEGLRGYKTYFMSAMSIVFGLVGGYTGWVDRATAVEFIVAGLGLGALRNGLPPSTPNADVGEKLPTSSLPTT
jgi:hypothetical protein